MYAPLTHTCLRPQDASGSLCYDEFCGSVFKLRPSIQNDPNSRSVVERVRAKIASRGGLNGIRTLGRILRTMDDNGNGKLDRYELEWGLRDYGVEVDSKVCPRGVAAIRGVRCACACAGPCVTWHVCRV